MNKKSILDTENCYDGNMPAMGQPIQNFARRIIN
jgi:hypothetical protein